MPRKVDHDQRRAEIAGAAVRLAGVSGLQGVTFRAVAVEAGVSVALIQHYFGSKQNLIMGAVDQVSIGMAARFGERLAALGPDAGPLDRLRAIAMSFLPTDDESRHAMTFYHGVGAVALTDPVMHGRGVHRNAGLLADIIADLLSAAQAEGRVDRALDPRVQARLLLAILLGLSLSVLLENDTVDDATIAVDTHLDRLR